MERLRLEGITLISLIAIAILSAVAWGQKPWKGFITNNNGVTEIENNGGGIYGKQIVDHIDFTPIQSIGEEEGPEQLLFSRHIMVDVDDQLNIFVLDIWNHRLIKFDQEGRFLWKAGRKGQGPGEFESPNCIKATGGGGLLVADQGGKCHIFDADGEFKTYLKMEKSVKAVISVSDDEIFANLWLRGQPGISAAYFAQDGKMIRKFPHEYHYGPKLSSRRRYNLGGQFVLSADKLFLSLPDSYEIREYSRQGKLTRIIHRDQKIRPPVLEDGYRFVLNDVSGPCHLTSEGYLVNELEIKAPSEDNRKQYLDLFDPTGRFLGSYPIPEDRYFALIDGADNFYFVETDPAIRLIKCRFLLN